MLESVTQKGDDRIVIVQECLRKVQRSHESPLTEGLIKVWKDALCVCVCVCVWRRRERIWVCQSLCTVIELNKSKCEHKSNYSCQSEFQPFHVFMLWEERRGE